MKKLFLSVLFFLISTPAFAVSCGAGSYNSTLNQCQGFITAGTTSWTVPFDFNSAANTFEAIGEGGNGGTSNQGDGGGGGAYAKISNSALTPGASIATQVGSGGTNTTTQFKDGSTLVADYGRTGTAGGPGAAGGLASNSVGTTKHSGGNGGAGCNDSSQLLRLEREGVDWIDEDRSLNLFLIIVSNFWGGGGGGAAGSTADGSVGGTSLCGTEAVGGAAGATNGGAQVAVNTAGNPGTTFDGSHGAGSGGGGSQFNATSPGAGGTYGGGGGGKGKSGGTLAVGGPGVIAFAYTPLAFGLPQIFLIKKDSEEPARYGVEVILNHNVHAKLLIDTGSSVVMLGKSFIKKLKLHPDRNTSVAVLGSMHMSYEFNLDSVKYMDKEVRNVDTVVLEDRDIINYDGVLGMSFLKNFDVTLKKKTGELILN